MHKLGTYVRSAVVLLTACSALAGCVVVPARGGGYVAAPAFVAVAPPVPRVEVIGAPPFYGAVWIGGYWRWAGDRHVWVAGRWEHPRAGYRWVPHAWVHEREGWRMAEGHWERR